jgi:hypothetical protein
LPNRPELREGEGKGTREGKGKRAMSGSAKPREPVRPCAREPGYTFLRLHGLIAP